MKHEHPSNIVCTYFLKNKQWKKKQQPGSTMQVQTAATSSICSKCEKCCTSCGNNSVPLVEHNFSLTSRHDPEPDVRNTAKNGDHDATKETPTTATAALGADDNSDDPDDEHEYVNTETDNNIESKKSHCYDIDK